MSYYDVPEGNPERELGRHIYMEALSDRRGFREDQLGIFDADIWTEIFEHIGREAAAASERYLLTTDNDSHWYVIPYSKRGEWQKWTELDQDDPAAWNVPDFAEEVGGSPTLVTFTGYKIGD